MTRKRPAVQRHTRRIRETRVPVPLRREQHLNRRPRARPVRQVDDQNRDARVGLVGRGGRRVAVESHGLAGRERRALWGEDLDGHGLVVPAEGDGRGAGCGRDSSVSLHAPLDVGGCGDLVLDEDLFAAGEETDTALDRDGGTGEGRKESVSKQLGKKISKPLTR
jgi:hypothetical protein